MISTFIANIKAVDTEWPDDRKSSHDEVAYTDMGMDTSEQCQGCSNWLVNGCRTVSNPIQLTGWCNRYKQALP